MSLAFWRPSDEQRRTVLLLEALGLIHDLGKLSDAFLQSEAPSSQVEYAHRLLANPRQVDLYKNYTALADEQATDFVKEWLTEAASKPAAFQERSDLTGILEQVQFTDWRGQTYSFAELMPLVARPGLAQTTANWQGVLGKDMQPGLLIGRLHGAAHIEKEGEPDRHKQPYSAVFRAMPFGLEERIGTGVRRELTLALTALPLADIAQIASGQRCHWLENMKAQMRRGLADNRRPHNEVSLWDWGYTVATMTKAAAAWVFKHGWPKDGDLNHLPYRTLRINLDILARYTRSDKISDLLGVRKVLDDAFRHVQTLLEETYALANRFYHDETGVYYLFSDLHSDAEVAALRQVIQAQFPSDLRPQVHLGKLITAGELDRDKSRARELVAEPRAQALHEAPVRADNNLYLFEEEWTAGRPDNAETCMVCGVRPVGYPRQGSPAEAAWELEAWADQEKAQQRNVCRICLARRSRRSQEWVEQGLHGTIWTDEVADDHGHLALFVGRLSLQGWLDGSLLSTLQVTSDTTKAPSPARLYRIAETARAFWQQVIDGLTPGVVGQRPFRLALYPEETHLPALGDFHTYELDVEGLALSVVWDKPHSRFLAAENLAYFAYRWRTTPDELASRLQGRRFDVLEPSAFQRPGYVLSRVHITHVEQLDGYQPTIPLLAEPGVCMTLVPAAKALGLARAVKREYEQQMGRVRDRLPLYLGLVFCQRRIPIRAVLEAGRTMLSIADREVWEGWRLIEHDTSNPSECVLGFDNGIAWRVPVLAGDGTTRDDWYPHLFVADSWQGVHSTRLRHIHTLQPRNPRIPPDRGPKVWVRPSRFDFEFLDTPGRRFEIHYGLDGRRPRCTRPFYLEDLDRLETLWDLMTRLAVSQRYQVIHTIEATRETWYGQANGAQASQDTVFRQLVADTLAGATWPPGQRWGSIAPAWQEQLIQAGVSGELADLAELHMEILQE
jgi:hypothetical protein